MQPQLLRIHTVARRISNADEYQPVGPLREFQGLRAPHLPCHRVVHVSAHLQAPWSASSRTLGLRPHWHSHTGFYSRSGDSSTSGHLPRRHAPPTDRARPCLGSGCGSDIGIGICGAVPAGPLAVVVAVAVVVGHTPGPRLGGGWRGLEQFVEEHRILSA
jgi:hypothetical protein